MKKYNELTENGKAARLAKYEAQRKELNDKYGVEVKNTLCRLGKDASIQENKDGSKRAVLRCAIYDATEKTTIWKTGSIYIAKGKDSYEAFLGSLKKGQLLAMDYVDNGDFIRIWNVFPRTDNRKKAVANAMAEEK